MQYMCLLNSNGCIIQYRILDPWFYQRNLFEKYKVGEYLDCEPCYDGKVYNNKTQNHCNQSSSSSQLNQKEQMPHAMCIVNVCLRC